MRRHFTRQSTPIPDSSDVKAALAALEKAHMVRRGDDGYRIPTPAEDDWERQRASLSPKPGDVSRLHAEVITGLWQPQPSHTLPRREGVQGRPLPRRSTDDRGRHLSSSEPGRDREETKPSESRRRASAVRPRPRRSSGSLPSTRPSTVRPSSCSGRREILSRKERGAQTKDETTLVAEEKTPASPPPGRIIAG